MNIIFKLVSKKMSFLFDTPKNYYDSIILNILGFQIVRVLWHNLIHFLKFLPKEVDTKEKNIISFHKDGILSIKEFFNKEDFLKIKSIFENKIDNLGIVEKDKNGSGVDWTTLVFNEKVEDEELKYVYDLISNNKTINNLVMSVIKKKITKNPSIGFQKLKNPANNSDDKDLQNTIHSDRFFPCIKINLNIDDNNSKNGAYWYSTGSHKLNFIRVVHEYIFSVVNSLFKKNIKFKNYIENNRCKPNPNIVPKIYKNFNQVCNPENTLVVSNNMGFHSKGQMMPNTERKQIRIIYYDLQRPFYYNFLKRLYDLFSK